MTLIELLVALAIVSVLIGAILPALSASRGAAQSVVCASNLRQLQAVNDAFAADHSDRYVAGAPDFRVGNLRRWHGARDTRTSEFEASRSPMAAYLDGDIGVTLRTCPTFVPALQELADTHEGFERAAGGYGYNNAYVGVVRRALAPGVWGVQSDLSGARRARFAAPAMTVGFADGAFAGRCGIIEYSFVEPPVWPDQPAYGTDPSVHFRHAGGALVVWLDSHVSREARTRSAPGFSSRLDSRTLGLGWFGEARDNRLFDYE